MFGFKQYLEWIRIYGHAKALIRMEVCGNEKQAQKIKKRNNIAAKQ